MRDFTFVIGAGASSEYGLPVGNKLKSDIVAALKQRSPGGNVADETLYYAMSEFARIDQQNPGNIQPYINATEQIGQSLLLSPSIDNFINSHQGDKRIEIVGKLAIAKCILDAERASSLRLGRDSRYDQRYPRQKPRLEINAFADTWMVSFFKLLNQDCHFSQLKAKLSKIALIIFNYDRCVEHFLFEAIKTFYRVSDTDASDALRSLDIHHPYGTIGDLAWQSDNHLPFGNEAQTHELCGAARNIKTFSESSALSDTDTESIRELISGSHNLVFLGFGFIPLNMNLLQPIKHHPDCRKNNIYATTFSISNFDKERIASELKGLSGSKLEPHFSDCKASDLFGQYTRGIRI